MSASISAPLDGNAPPEIVAGIFYGACVTDVLVILVAETVGTTTRLTWGNQGAVKLLGYGLEDLRSLPHHNDRSGYAELVAAEPAFAGRRAAEVRRYGIHALRLTAVALEQWGFPPTMISSLKRVDDLTAPDGGLLRAAFEAAARITGEDYEPVPIAQLTCGRLGEEAVAGVLGQVRLEAEELRSAMLA